MLSVIIPTLNEADLLPATLRNIRANPEPHEILVADGGSEDRTAALSREAGAQVVASPVANRAAQMNLGAALAQGDILLFLHADTRIGPTALSQIVVALAAPAVVGGGFARRFDSPSPLLRFTARMGEWRSRCFGWYYGDQGIFVRRTVFRQLDGFGNLPAFEDVDFTRRMARQGKVVTLRANVISSARRFSARGPAATSLSDLWLTLRYLAGADPRCLLRSREQRLHPSNVAAPTLDKKGTRRS
jgi:rSAM/selenodomain-associated transferase 2